MKATKLIQLHVHQQQQLGQAHRRLAANALFDEVESTILSRHALASLADGFSVLRCLLSRVLQRGEQRRGGEGEGCRTEMDRMQMAILREHRETFEE